MYARFTLSLRDVEELSAERRFDISYETVRRWFLKFGQVYARDDQVSASESASPPIPRDVPVINTVLPSRSKLGVVSAGIRPSLRRLFATVAVDLLLGNFIARTGGILVTLAHGDARRLGI